MRTIKLKVVLIEVNNEQVKSSVFNILTRHACEDLTIDVKNSKTVNSQSSWLLSKFELLIFDY